MCKTCGKIYERRFRNPHSTLLLLNFPSPRTFIKWLKTLLCRANNSLADVLWLHYAPVFGRISISAVNSGSCWVTKIIVTAHAMYYLFWAILWGRDRDLLKCCCCILVTAGVPTNENMVAWYIRLMLGWAWKINKYFSVSL